MRKLRIAGQTLSLLFFTAGVIAHIMSNYDFAYFLFFSALFVKIEASK